MAEVKLNTYLIGFSLSGGYDRPDLLTLNLLDAVGDPVDLNMFVSQVPEEFMDNLAGHIRKNGKLFSVFNAKVTLTVEVQDAKSTDPR